ncbi:Protein N-acetyltransferase, RimJ/RimL family [Micromonospora pattaloongensis]|uniref:Protein N-acetyltransferase, RimJ/RimL family n=1 Tax=Micromonospora pattaloongensis TaxID=405436 RepID=A0A1H3KFX3_9ACTN|nr:GNAT family N-acetyltransferase [Micromonospora pattaloongensis]SDY50940.1 Protein N-acetyltransferase, RimJ/RimL family [Micromonospora pattaloongensis]
MNADIAEPRTARLVLRRPVPSDLDAVHEVHGDPATNRHNPSGPTTLEGSRRLLAEWIAHWERHGFGYWTVRRAEDGAVLGFGGVRHKDLDGEPVLNLYYRFSPRAWGQGYAVELARAAVAFGRALGGPPVVALINLTNEPSRRVAERAGLVAAEIIEYEGALSPVYRLPDATP